jgi:hypothetical protein
MVSSAHERNTQEDLAIKITVLNIQIRDTSGRPNATMKLPAQTFIWGNVMVGRLTEAQRMTVSSSFKFKLIFITIFVNLGLFRHFETVTNIRTWMKSHRYWRMLQDANTLKLVFISRTQ